MFVLSLGLLFRLLFALLVLFHIVEKIDDLLGSILDDTHQIDLFVFAIANDFGDTCT